ncbi:MAG: sigma-70 family RNA polymerase sigma factor [Pirellulales bacterium]
MDDQRLRPPIEVCGQSDAELIHRFLRTGDEPAFRLLVTRYHALVLGVCRRVLRHQQLAEDAYQSTFLTLAQRASTIRQREVIASWLYGVAYRIAWRVQRREARRMSHQLLIDVPDEDNPLERLSRDYEQEILDDEIQRLPESLRVPVLLRYQLDLSNLEVAERLKLTEAAVEGRLKRARTQLRFRLARQGVSLGAALALLSGAQECLAMPAGRLIELAVSAAGSGRWGPVGGGESVVSQSVRELVEQEIWQMAIRKTAMWAAPAVAAGSMMLAVAGLGSARGQEQGTGSAGAGTVPAEVVAVPEASTENGAATSVSVAGAESGGGDPFAAGAADGAGAAGGGGVGGGAGSGFGVAPPGGGAAPGGVAAPGAAYGVGSMAGGGVGSASTGGGMPGTPGMIGGGGGMMAGMGPGPSGLEVGVQNDSVRRIRFALEAPMEVDFSNAPLSDVLNYVHERLNSTAGNISLVIDTGALEDIGMTLETPVTIRVSGVSARSALKHILQPLQMQAVVSDEVLRITSEDKANDISEIRFYRVPASMEANTDMSELISLIKMVDPERFGQPDATNGSTDQVRFVTTNRFRGVAVRTSPQVHDQIIDLLRQLD